MASVDPLATEASTGPKRSRRSRGVALAILAVVGVLATSTAALARSGADTLHVEAGVSLAGQVVAGKDAAGLRADIAVLEDRISHAPIALTLAGRQCRFDPSAAGFTVDAEATVASTLEAARGRTVFAKLKALAGKHTEVPLVVAFDDQAYGEVIADCEKKLIDDIPTEGAIVFEGLVPKAVLPKAGHRVRTDALRAALMSEVASGTSAPIELPIEGETPKLRAADVENALETVKGLVSKPITLVREPTSEEIEAANKASAARDREIQEMKSLAPKTKKKHRKKGDQDAPPPKAPPPVAMPKTITLTMTEAELCAAVRATIEGDPAHLDVHLDSAEVERKLADVSADLADSARDARFDVDDKDQITIVPSQTGTRVDPAKVATALFAAAKTADRRGELPVDHGAEPALTTEQAEKLGIKGLVASFTTHHPCCQPRVVNIHRIADLMDGVVVRPGETFSVNKFVGPRTAARGFVLAPSIGDGEMVDTVGGGISQFATTLFNSLFDGGYAIKERKAHSYYFSRYPMGIEATLSDPSPDLVFENDTDAGVLIKTKYDKTSITVRLYGDNGGRKTERHVSSVFDITQPKVEYEANDKLDPDEEKVVERGSDGWSVWVTRAIIMPNGERREEKRKITYNARPRTVRVHSCKIPKGEPDYTGRPCPKKKDSDSDHDDTTTASSTGGFDPNAVDPSQQ